jgi:hypothetical protein
MATKKPAKRASAKKKPTKKAAAPKSKPAPKPAKKPAKKKALKKTAARAQSMKPQDQTLDTPAFVSANPLDAYNHFLAMVKAYPAEDVAVASVSAAVVRHNVARAFSAVQPFLSMASQLVPSVSIERLMELPTLALALEFADRQIPSSASTGEIETALDKVSEPRELTLSYLEIVGALGIVDEKRVADIRAGSGKLDKAQDCVDIGAMFDDQASALAGKHPFPSGYVAAMASTGAWLVQHLTPKGAVRDRANRSQEADMRDRFYKAVRERYDDLEKVAVALWGLRGAEEHIPALLSHEHAKKETNADAPPPPPATTTPATPPPAG